MKKISKILFFLFSCCLFISVGGLLFTKVYFTPERVRAFAEKNIGVLLNEKISIHHLNFSLLSGFEAADISMGGKEGPLHIARISFQYDFSQLLQGKSAIVEIAVDRPALFLEKKNGRWNFEKYLLSGEPGKEEPASHGLNLPLPVHIKSFEISDLSLRMKDETRTVTWEGLDLAATAHFSREKMALDAKIQDNIKGALPSRLEAVLGRDPGPSESSSISLSTVPKIRFHLSGDHPEKAQLEGYLHLDNLLLTEGKDHMATQAGLSLEVVMNPVAGEVTLTHMALDLLKKNTIHLKGKISNLHTDPLIQARLEYAFFQIASLPPFIKPFFPNLRLHGTLEGREIEFEARMDSTGEFQAKAAGGLTLDQFSLEDDSLGLTVKDLKGHLNLVKVEADSTGDVSGSLAMNMEMEEGGYREYRLSGFACQTDLLSFQRKEGVPQSLTGVVTTKIRSASLPRGNMKEMKVQVDMRREGPHRGHLTLSNSIQSLHYRLPDQSEVHSSVDLNLSIDLADEKFENIGIQGRIDFPDLSMRIKDIRQTFFLSLEPKLSLNWPQKKMDLESLVLHLPGKNQLNIHGTFSQGDMINARLKANGFILLNPLSSFASKFIKDFQAEGLLELQEVLLSLTADPEQRTLSTESRGTLKLNGVAASCAGNFVKGLEGKIQWEASGLNEKGFQNAAGEWEADLTFRSGGTEEFSLKTAKAKTILQAEDTGRTTGRFNLYAEEAKVLLSEGAVSTPLQLEGEAEGDFKEGNFHLKVMTLNLGKALSGKIQGKVKSEGEGGVEMDGRFLADLESLGKMAQAANLSSYSEKLEMTGRLESRVLVSGRLKNLKSEEIDWKKFPSESLPFSVSLDLDLQEVGLDLLDNKLIVAKMTGPLSFRYGEEGAVLHSRIDMESIQYPEIGAPPLSLKAEADIQCQPSQGITITTLNFSIPEWGLHHASRGYIDGLEPFLKEGIEPNPQNILHAIQCRLKSETSLDASHSLTLFEDSRIQGRARASLLLDLTPGEKLVVEGGLDFHQFNLDSGSSASIKNLEGVLPFRKKFSLKTQKEEEGNERKRAVSKSGALHKDIFSYLPDREKLTAESLTVLGHELSQIQMEPSPRENSVALDRFSFKALGGYGAGRLSLSDGEEMGRIALDLEFVGIDANRLRGMEPDPHSTMNGNMSIRVPLPGATGEELELGALDLEINITRIGEEALGRLLLFIDPKESNPSIVDLRSKLQLAVPTGAKIKLKHGALSVSTQLKLLAMGGGILDIEALERVPVSRLSSFQRINALLDEAQTLATWANIFFLENPLLDDQNR